MNLHYHYDHEADTLYISQGKPSSRDISEEADDDVVLRINPKTREVHGFTVLNFVRRLGHKKDATVRLPIRVELTPA